MVEALLLCVTVLATVVTTASPAAAESTGKSNWSGYVATTPNADCVYLSETMQMGNYFQPGQPRLDTYGSLDWRDPNNGQACGLKSYQAWPGDLYIKQDLWWWDGSNQLVCNGGSWVGNNYYFTHALSTGFGWNQPPCGNIHGVWMYQDSSTWYWTGDQTSETGHWDYGWRYTSWQYVWVS